MKRKDEVVYHIQPIADGFALYTDGLGVSDAAPVAVDENPRALSRKAFDELGATIVRWDFDLKLAEDGR